MSGRGGPHDATRGIPTGRSANECSANGCSANECSGDASSRLTRSIDRAVLSARAERLIDLAGRMTVAAAVVVAAVVVASRAGLPAGFPTGPIAILAAVGLAAWTVARRWRWPDRLTTAMAIERDRPWLGERISRAVGLLGESPRPPGSPHDLLVREAVEEAANTLEGLSRDRSAGLAAGTRTFERLRWPAGGLAAAAAVAIAAVALPERVGRPIVEAFAMPLAVEPEIRPAESALSGAALAAAARLADAAATEERLVSALRSRFVASPGTPREDMPRMEQEWLDEVASLQEAIAGDIGHDLSLVSSAFAASRPQIASALVGDGIEVRATELRDAAAAIRGNRLAAAARAITLHARPILDSLRACGIAASTHAGPAIDRAGLVRRRIVAAIDVAIDADATRAAGVGAAGSAPPSTRPDDLAPSASTDRGPAPSLVVTATSPGPVASTQAGPSAGEGAGDGSGSGPVGEEPPREAPGRIVAEPGGRLPDWVSARASLPTQAILGDATGVPPRYRAAVDGYYLRLWKAESRPQDQRRPSR